MSARISGLATESAARSMVLMAPLITSMARAAFWIPRTLGEAVGWVIVYSLRAIMGKSANFCTRPKMAFVGARTSRNLCVN